VNRFALDDAVCAGETEPLTLEEKLREDQM
jgi:hypothetical protein